MRWIYNDGGRKAAGYRGTARDCVVRAIAIATGVGYQTVYEGLQKATERERPRKGRSRRSPRDGVKIATIRRYMAERGYRWVPTMQIGSGCEVHLREDELPTGRLVVSVSKHMTAVVNGVIQDVYNPDRDGTRCVYGYFVVE